MKKIEVKVRYLFEGTYTVLGGDIHTTLDDDEVD